jgi:hypothetical protein
MITLDCLKRELLTRDDVCAEYDALAEQFLLTEMLFGARTKVGMTHAQVAERI